MSANNLISKKPRAAVYARSSAPGSIELQQDACRDHANRLGLDVDARLEFIDVGPSDGETTGFEALLSAVRGGRVDVVFVAGPDRLARSGSGLHGALQTLAESHVRVVFVDGAGGATN